MADVIRKKVIEDMKKQGVPNSEIMKKLHLRYWELRKILDDKEEREDL